jgi:signal transduction histidine kinase
VLPRSLLGRLLLSFSAIALALVIVIGGALFFVLRGLHADATLSGLSDLAGSLLPQLRTSVVEGDLRGTVAEMRSKLAARGIRLLIVGPDGRLREIDGLPFGQPIIADDPAAGDTVEGTTTLEDGRRALYSATVLRERRLPTAPRALAFVAVDRSGAQALADIGRAVPAVLVVVALVAAPLAWLLARSVSRPLTRLADGASAVATGSTADLPLEGPAEVRRATAAFNAMSAELAASRAREGELLADLRHDLRTPLTVIAGWAAALADGTASGDDAARAARTIESEAGRLERMVEELGALERIRSGEAGLRPEVIDGRALADEVVARFAARAEAAGVSLVAVAADRDVELGFVADRMAVDRIVGNLVANAVAAATPPAGGGHAWIEVRRFEPAGGPAVIVIALTDDGPGFGPGEAARAFERFWRADPARSGGGSGLGLSIVRELAQAHGGSAVAENVAPHGARVSVTLPLVPPAG